MRFLLFLVAFCNLYTQDIDSKDVRGILVEMMSYHVDYKELNVKVVRRAIKRSIDLFDPTRSYLLEHEVEPFLALSDEALQQEIRNYYHNEYPLFDALFVLFEDADRRAKEIEKSLIISDIRISRPARGYPKNAQELKGYIHHRTAELMKRELRRSFVQNVAYADIQGFVLKKEWERRSQFDEKYTCIVKAIAKSLDPYTGYYSEKEASDIRARWHKQFCGTGIQFRETCRGVFVSGVLTSTPAERCGMVNMGDQLTHIDGVAIGDRSFKKVMEETRGSEGSKVSFTLCRGENEYTVHLIRERIIMQKDRVSVETVPFANGTLAVVTLPSFYDNGEGMSLVEDFKTAITSIKGPVHGLVLDLRENPGGFLSQAVKFAGMFIPKGLVVISRYSNGEVKYTRDEDSKAAFSKPVILLTSKASASCAEIVAQALQDYGVALVVGDKRTYGKGSTQYQTITDPYAKTYYKVTVGRYYTASGRSTQLEGVLADIHIPTHYAPHNIGERFHKNPIAQEHLPSDHLEILNAMHSGAFPYAKPYLRPQETKWRKMLPILRQNSLERRNRNINFQNYLKNLYENGDLPTGSGDLLKTESLEILRDMHHLSGTH